MELKLKTHLVDWNYDGSEALEPKTEIEVAVLSTKVDIELTGDQVHGVTHNRSVTLEIDKDDNLRVIVYGFDQGEPRVFFVGLDGSIEERTRG